MAGKNLMLKPGQILFKEGDVSNGMFIIRKGELAVFLEQEEKHVVLAKIGAGGMIGEMALFDKQPRSASVKAITPVEVSVITNGDFLKLMSQIPKWFVGLMGTLSGRLRQTNERLQKLEGMHKGKPFEQTLLILHLLNLMWHKDGVKEGKQWLLDRKTASEPLKVMLGDKQEMVEPIISVLVECGLVQLQKNSYNAEALSLPNRGALERFLHFFQGFQRMDTGKPGLSDEAYDILKAMRAQVENAAYEKVTVSINDLKVEGKKLELPNIAKWDNAVMEFKGARDGVTLAKTSDGKPGLNVEKKQMERVFKYHGWIRAFAMKELTQ